ncbi:MAG: folate-binding protein YgfZ, partial [Mariniblastus sp.]
MPDAKSLTLEEQYSLLNSGAGFVELHDQCFVGLTGEDRHAFLHNFCTADTKKLQHGKSCEAMVLNTKGKMLGFVHAIASETELLLTGNANQAPTLIEHLDKYLIREDVELKDRTPELSGIFFAPATEDAFDALGKIIGAVPVENEHRESEIAGVKCRVCRLELAGFGILLVVEKTSLANVKNWLTENGLTACSVNSLEVIRVENKTPWFGIDADDSNLPQELQRDEKAISFVKGCYLGQETVARIDAIGRVNQLLVGLKFVADSTPAVGMEFKEDEKVIGRVTSVANSPTQGSIGLGYIRRK